MKIGILTFHNTLNYGSFLQTLGLFHVLQKMGYECVVIDYECKAIESVEIPKLILESLSPRKIAKYFLVTKKIKKKYNHFQKDMHIYLTLSERYTKENINKANSEFDIFLVGSDILWDLDLTKRDLTYFLNFTKNAKKKYSFATSIGRKWRDEETELLKGLLADFQRIAIREKTSAEWLRELMPNNRIDTVCDPTMLCSSSYWKEIAELGRKINEKYVCIYFPSERIIQDAMEFSKIHDCKIICIGFKLLSLKIKYIIPESISDFLSLLKGAEAVFTGSYHGTLFSLYFEKQVYVYYRENRGHNIRMTDLMDHLNIVDSCTYSVENSNRIDYKEVSKTIEKWRNDSLDILKGYWKFS